MSKKLIDEESIKKLEEFGNNLKKLLKVKNISQVALAKCLGVNKNTVLNWANGKSEPTYISLLGLFEFFKEDAPVELFFNNYCNKCNIEKIISDCNKRLEEKDKKHKKEIDKLTKKLDKLQRRW